MSSKVRQTDPQQAGQAFNTGASLSGQGQAMGREQYAQANALWHKLYGKGGSVSSFLDPNTMDVSSPTGPFSKMYATQAQDIARQGNNALTSNWCDDNLGRVHC